MLSLLAYHDPDATVEGLDAVPADDRPPVGVVRNAFRLMVGLGTRVAALAAVYLVTWWRRRRLPRSKWFYRAVVLAGPAALVALIAGWIMTEVGRQPWIVYEVMRTEEAVTGAERDPGRLRDAGARLPRRSRAVVFWLLRRLARHPIEDGAPGRATPHERCRRSSSRARPRRDRLRGARRRRLRRRLLGPDRRRRRARRRVRGLVKRSMGPVWEANHVWLIFVLVIFWTALSRGLRAGDVDALRAALPRRRRDHLPRRRVRRPRRGGDDRRGACARRRRSRSPRCWCRSSSAPRSARSPPARCRSGRRRRRDSTAGPASTSIYVGVLAVATGAYLAAVFLAADAVRAELPDLVRGLPRAGARRRGGRRGCSRSAASSVVRDDAPDLYDGLTSGVGLAVVIASALAGR